MCVALGHNTSDYIHTVVEAIRLSLTDAQRYLGDPQHESLPVETLLDKNYSEQRAQRISVNRCVCVWWSVPVRSCRPLLTLDRTLAFYFPPA